MDKIGLFWGSTTGNQEEAGKFLVDYMTSEGFEIDSYDIRSTDPAKMLEYKNRLEIGKLSQLKEENSVHFLYENIILMFCLIICKQ